MCVRERDVCVQYVIQASTHTHTCTHTHTWTEKWDLESIGLECIGLTSCWSFLLLPACQLHLRFAHSAADEGGGHALGGGLDMFTRKLLFNRVEKLLTGVEGFAAERVFRGQLLQTPPIHMRTNYLLT